MSKIIDDNLLAIFNTITRNRNDWKYVTDEQKKKFHFIINRNFSKIYPDESQLLNDKFIDKEIAMDLWFHFMKGKPYPSNFWSKGEAKEKEILSDKDYLMLLSKLKIKDLDLDFLIKNNFDFIKEELKYYKDLEKI